MNNTIYKIFDKYNNSKYISFEYDTEFGIIVKFYNKNNYFFGNFKKFNNIDNSNEICLDINSSKLVISDLLKFFSKYEFIENNNNNNENFTLGNNGIIVGCNCLGGIIEHNMIIQNKDNILRFKLFLYDIDDSILLGKTQTDFITNYLLKYAG